MEQQKASATAGMWVFLTSEIMFFGAIIASFIIYGYLYPNIFADFSKKLHLLLGSINTGVLLTSSWTMALAVHASQTKDRRKLLLLLGLTLILGSLFLGIKGYEWSEEINKGDFPGAQNFHPRQGEMFLGLYFIMTGFHGLHVLIGLLLMSLLAFHAFRNKHMSLSQIHFTENLGLYWHFVDIVWIFLFPLLYLMDQPRVPW
jgi:cytochrome c oxidase subunit 3